MSKSNIIRGQAVSLKLLQRAHELRQQMTPAEKALWQHLRANRLAGFHFRRQQVIHNSIVDFNCHKVSLVVEIDGPIHLQQKEQDAERDRHLENLGLQVLRFINEQVETDIESVLEEIREHLT